MSLQQLEESLYNRIKVLNETLWEHRIRKKNIEEWLSNFQSDEEIHMLYLLSQFMYFGSTQMRQLLISLYRDLYKYPIIKQIRKANGNTLDSGIIEPEFKRIQLSTRFFGIGNPSESGAHLLYFFRQENNLSKRLFQNTSEIFDRKGGTLILRDPSILYYVFIDDFCGSGSQVSSDTSLSNTIQELKSLNPSISICYLMLFGTSKGIDNVRKAGMFDYVDAVIHLDESFSCFNPKSRYFANVVAPFNIAIAEKICRDYGVPLIQQIIESEGGSPAEAMALAPTHALGFNNSQLLIGFHHNTPDNTLPVIWYDEDAIPWRPIFRRYNKKYGF
ncbi:phosphoribosyltransferase-like protein [Pseudocnuella soli]|uniref:phosphoribosyltransferase-like protein n=1 Tax=Pseudocnuella soli TaxID=2502779 RepID=UPI001050C2B4|nr:hypothetical protein [Pseudocnuella soli]